MKKRLNQKGFTLVELLAVLVILVAITSIAIPTISSSLERTKEKQNESRYKIIESAAEQYVTDHKNAVYNKLSSDDSTSCYIQIKELTTYLSNDEMQDADENDLSIYYVIFEKPSNYKYSITDQSLSSCI